MTGSPDLTPEHDAVRRLLADARHAGSTPPEVVARLDEALAALVAERSAAVAPPAQARVVDLAARRRRLAGTGLLAAAAVVVAGVALGQVLPVGEGSDDAGSSAGSADSDTSLAEDDAGAGASAEGGEDGSSSQEMAPHSKSASPAPLAAVPTLSSADPDLAQDVEALRATAPSSARADRLQTLDLLRSCDLPALGRGRRVAAEVDGQPGLVFFQPVDAAAQGVAVYVCGTPEPVSTLTLPAP